MTLTYCGRGKANPGPLHKESNTMNFCKTPDCCQPLRSEHGGRGLCQLCYQSALSLIRRGITSWVELEEMGLTVPAKKARGKTLPTSSTFVRAFNRRKSEQLVPMLDYMRPT